MAKAGNSQIMRIITLLITIFSLSLPAYAQYGGGSGEPNDPYLITTGADLISISQNQGDWDKHFRLTADLDLTDMDLSDYTPIGTSQGSGDNYMVIPFQGIFDGNDHSIIGFTFSGNYTVGLFGIVDKGAYIMNLNLVDPNVQGWSWVGALVGELREATVAYCTIQGGRVSKPLDFRGSSVLYGGLIGCNSAGTVTMCHATCDVPAGNSSVGGLVGENLSIIQNCFATGTIGKEQIPRLHSGGLVGWNKGSITGCYATGDVYGEEYETGGLVGCNNGPVTHCHATGDIFGQNGVGGLVGINRQEDDEFDFLMGTIVDCYATGSVHADGKGAGGLVGYNAGEISGSYATGRVNGKEDVGGLVGSNEYIDQGRIADSYASGRVTGEKHVGGLVGINPGAISRCYAAGSVSGFEKAGGLIGMNSQSRGGRTIAGTVIACFWNIETSGQSSSAGGNGVVGKITAEMQDPNLYLDAGWDFVDETANGTEDIWWIFEGQDYPRLWWQYGRAFFPHPQDGATDVIQPLLLNWTPGGSNLSHDVYFGEDAEAVADATTESLVIYRGRQTPEITSYDPGNLRLGKTYYWRIDEVNVADPNNTWKGSIWSFTTTDFIVVDDFEDYDAVNQVWFSWHDGLGYGGPGFERYYPGNGTGSAVGDETWITGSHMETDIVYGGRQSMPYSYDNNKTGFLKYSEATLTLDYPRNWTERDVEVLSLWFYGYPANAPEPMYVAVADANGPTAGVVYNDNPDAALIDSWTEWTIGLQDFADQGVNLTDVNSIAIGFGNRDNPQPGSSGKMYFDDIRLYQLLP